jgi:cell pole-organizing protein PopZ
MPPPEPEPVRYTEPARYAESPASWQAEAVALPPPPLPRETHRTRADASSILSGDSAQAVQAAFNRLADTVLSRATGDRSIEDLTRELLRGMLKQWLDDNLPAMVERMVREEIERVARNGR